jgi:hypothetical protein
MRNPPEPDLTFPLKLKMHTNLLSSLLKKNKGIDAIICPNYDPSKIEDGYYLYILKNNPNNNPNLKKDFTDFILKMCEKKINIKYAFNKSQEKMITQIAKEIKLKDVESFFDFELERLQREVKPDDIKKENEIQLDKSQRHENKVNDIIKLFEDNPSNPINLKLEIFFMLIREYCHATDILRESKYSDEKEQQEKQRLHKISKLIYENRDSVNFFKDSYVVNQPKLKNDIIIYMHALCFNGHIDNLETLMKNHLSKEDLLSVINAIEPKSDFSGEVTISGLSNIIDKRIQLQRKDGSGPQKDTSRWAEVSKIFKNGLKQRYEAEVAEFKKWQEGKGSDKALNKKCEAEVAESDEDRREKSENPEPGRSLQVRVWRALALGSVTALRE